MSHSLFISAGPDRGRQAVLADREIVLIGRGETCDVRLSDPSASRIHCRIHSQYDRLKLTDAGSRWGTFVNGQRVTECDLKSGDEIRIGDTLLKLSVCNGPRATTIPSADAAGPLVGATPHSVSPADRSFVDCKRQADPAISGQPRCGRPLAPEEFAGQSFGRFEVHKHVATSASGLVFRANDPQSARPVALKLFHPSCLSQESGRQRFLRAIRTMVGLRHDHLVTLHAAGRHDGLCYMVSEFIDGPSASELIRTWGIAGMLDWRCVLRTGIDIASALEFAAVHKIVHRNITPRNILIRHSNGSALLNDLLLAKALDETPVSRITQPGEIVGDLPYLSPEQLGSGSPVDQRSDIYQLGATLYALLAGRPPHEGRSTAETIQQVLTVEPISPVRYQLAIPRTLEGIILHMLSKRPGDRFASAAELLQDLKSAERHLNWVS